ncbi:progestin and adipoQ receptor family member 3 [Eurytemora carolleeae]|uniref:progestin and adipoQ receptor family member 3 n=1 Tax=Eurytemora carolleeae TaxID=1294199 RepID=UPI000C773144|nr:progestin and adipoQ receptor family member 3 [Eurytemora carolleeae]|eukprot:XP_023344521.1 progestin and adipoQ receptor family member 3-like [Eurytemora affinis]
MQTFNCFTKPVHCTHQPGAGTLEKKHVLLKGKDVPVFVREDSIYTGYRTTLGYTECIKSVFRLHNETVNIWSHFLGFLYFGFLLCINIFQSHPHNRSSADLIAVCIQLVTYQICMILSSMFHTFLCHSERVKYKWKEADHSGILIALWGTYTRIIVTNFSCFPSWLLFHLLLVTILFSLVFLQRWWNREKRQKGGVELYLFLALSMYAVAPLAHWLSISPTLVHNNTTAQKIFWILVPYGLGGLGLFFYISRIPERIVPPGQVDLCGASHQLWHIFILAGMVSWYDLTCWLSTTRPQSCQLISSF